jgi:hypothetical protein
LVPVLDRMMHRSKKLSPGKVQVADIKTAIFPGEVLLER